RRRNELQEDAATRAQRAGVGFGLRQLADQAQPGARSLRAQLQDQFVGQVREETGNRLTGAQDRELAAQRVDEFIDKLVEAITGSGGLTEALRLLKEAGVSVTPETIRQLGTLGARGGGINRAELLRGEDRQRREEALQLTAAGAAVPGARTEVAEAKDNLVELRDEFVRTRQELVEDFQQATRDSARGLRELNLEAQNFLRTLLQGDVGLKASLVAGVRGAAAGNVSGAGGFIGPLLPAGIGVSPAGLLAGAQSQAAGLGTLANTQAGNISNNSSSQISIVINGQNASPTLTPKARNLI